MTKQIAQSCQYAAMRRKFRFSTSINEDPSLVLPCCPLQFAAFAAPVALAAVTFPKPVTPLPRCGNFGLRFFLFSALRCQGPYRRKCFLPACIIRGFLPQVVAREVTFSLHYYCTFFPVQKNSLPECWFRNRYYCFEIAAAFSCKRPVLYGTVPFPVYKFSGQFIKNQPV